MKENSENIENTFRNAFDNFETDVNPQVWSNIQQHIRVAPGAGGAAAGAGKLSGFTIGVTSSVIAVVAVLSYYFISYNNTTSHPASKQTEQPVISENPPSILPSINNSPAAEKKPENKITRNVATSEKKKPEPITTDAGSDRTVIAETKNQAAVATPDHNADKSNSIPSEKNKNAEKNSQAPTNNSDKTAGDKHENTAPPIPQKEIKNPDVQSLTDNFEWGSIPNIFTPNGDGRNDTFTIKNDKIKTINVTVTDREGKMVYKWDSTEGSWDGKDMKGDDAPNAVYLYFIFAESVDGKAYHTKGTITLLR